MTSSSASICIEELVARKTVKHGDEFSTVTIPQLPALSAADRRALCAKSELDRSEQDTRPVDLDAVNTMLEKFSREPSITPPPEANIARSRELEEQSRKALLDASCPPCYPPDLEFPLQDVPEKYEVVSYWQSLAGTGHMVLTTQLSDWGVFCEFQDKIRQYCLKRGTFPNFVDKVHDRRRRHGLETDVRLLPDPKQQSRLENWIEFQNYHLHSHECKEMEVKDKREKWDAARKEAERSGLGDAGKLDLEGEMKHSECKLKEHDKMLRWIEQQRKTMAAEQAASVYATGHHERPKSISTSTSLGHRKRNQKPRSPLSLVLSAVSKKSPKRKTLRPSKRNESQPAKNATADPNASRRRRRIPEPGVRASRWGEESTLLSPFNPQKVAKTTETTKKGCKGKIWANNNAKPQKAGRFNCRKPVQKGAVVVVTTRSGRKSKRP